MSYERYYNEEINFGLSTQHGKTFVTKKLAKQYLNCVYLGRFFDCVVKADFVVANEEYNKFKFL